MMKFLSREATVAKAGFNRWLVPPAAIAVHMCIGEVYGFSVFNVPLTQAGAGWTIPQVGWIYSISLFMLGMSAAVFGKWVERSGPRKTMVASCVCFCGGLLISAVGVKLKMLWLLYVGYGVIGGIGLRPTTCKIGVDVAFQTFGFVGLVYNATFARVEKIWTDMHY